MPEGTLRGTLAQPIFEMLGAPRHSRRVEELVARYKAGRFAETLESNQPAKAAGQLRVFSNLIADRAVFDDARERTLTEYLTRSKGFHFNGPFLAISRLIETRTASEQPSLAVDLQLTDYYIRRVYPHARDSTFEASIINESRWDSATGLPEHSAPGIHRLITSTVGTRPRATWDEGALVTVMLASLASTH